MEKLMLRLFGHKPKKHTEETKPVLKITVPDNQPEFNDWCKEFKISSRYGLKGSFYNN